MSKNRVAVLKVIHQQLSVCEAAAQYGLSRQHLHRLLSRYHQGGLEAVDPQSRRPRTNPQSTTPQVHDRILELRKLLVTSGLDAGPVTIAWHLQREGHTVPSTSTIRRILHTAGLVIPEPKKRPRTSYIRFEAAQPNETWQSDFTHWHLADGTDIEILNWLDDHSRYLLACTAHTPVTGTIVIDQFTRTTNKYGLPASTLTDNGLVYTARFRKGRNAFEYLLAHLGIIQKNGSPGHPQTQGKIERFHQTPKRWLTQQPKARNLAELQNQLDAFRQVYNIDRPHRALDRRTPGQAYFATAKATPQGSKTPEHYRLRYDHVDSGGKMSLRRAGHMHHLGIGVAHAGNPVLAITDHTHVTVIKLTTGEILSEHIIDPNRTYWRNQKKKPGRWPGSSKT